MTWIIKRVSCANPACDTEFDHKENTNAFKLTDRKHRGPYCSLKCKDEDKHGRRATYQQGCRCDLCREAASLHRQHRRAIWNQALNDSDVGRPKGELLS